ncbi:MAG: roadblock/LC7 domain-containing protein [Verrucomicrobia bacterium]|nr:roadblock/LC7 domain-containing protein [Verrucomicrobiota bacterium]
MSAERSTNPDDDSASVAAACGSKVDVASILKDLRHRADLLSVALLHETGVVMAQEGDERFQDQGEIGALTAGAFHATAMLGNRLGDSNVEALCHEGRHQSFLIIPVDAMHLLLAVFPGACKSAVVRLCMQRSAAALRGEPIEDGIRSEEKNIADWLGA